MSLKSILTEYYEENRANYDSEETDNVLEILNEYDDNLSNLSGWNKTLLLRLIDDSELYEKVDSINRKEDYEDKNLFD